MRHRQARPGKGWRCQNLIGHAQVLPISDFILKQVLERLDELQLIFSGKAADIWWV